MKRIRRLPLSQDALDMLADRSERVAASDDPKVEAAAAWESKRSQAWDAIRETLCAMASGSNCCMYCENGEAGFIDHFWPKSMFPERAFEWPNFLWSCSICNGNKSNDFPTEDGRPVLLDPTAEDPADHIAFNPTTGKWKEKRRSVRGSTTIRVFDLGRFDELRRVAWTTFGLYVHQYGVVKARGDERRASELLHMMRRLPFAGVLEALLAYARDPRRRRFVDAEVLGVLDSHPELHALFEDPHAA